MGKVLFVSQLPLGRCENLTAVWEAFDGDKEFRHGVESMASAEEEGFDLVVCDALPVYVRGKSHCKVLNICHGITGNKYYGNDEFVKPWFDGDAAMQTDCATAASEGTARIVAQQLCIPVERVAVTGFPRTDAYFSEGDVFETAFGEKFDRAYLYAPTFRNGDGRLPRIDWAKVDSLLEDGEVMVVKRHYFTENELTRGYDVQNRRVIEVPPNIASKKYLRSCDVVVTDYSSIMADAYLLGKPVVLTCDDMDEYIGKRGMYYPYPDTYSSRWLNVEEREMALVSMLRDAAENGMGETERRYIELVAGACDGHATERVCELIGEMS